MPGRDPAVTPSLPSRSILAALCLCVAAGCSGGGSERAQSPRPTPAAQRDVSPSEVALQPDSSGRSELTPLTAPMRIAHIRWARGNVPRSVPEPDVSLPSLLDDP